MKTRSMNPRLIGLDVFGRWLLPAFGLLTFLLLQSRVMSAALSPESPLSLAGTWSFELDRHDTGKTEGWFKRELTGHISLPGSMTENKLGDPMNGIHQHAWEKILDRPTWHPMLKYDYRGAAWYQKSVNIPSSWQGKLVELSLERVCWQSELWVDDIAVARCDSLSTPHGYELGLLTPGAHRLTLRIDNRQLHDLDLNTHAYHEQSCTIYNGVIGRMELRARPAVFARTCQVYPDAATGQCEIRVAVANKTGKDTECQLTASITQEGRAQLAGTIRQTVTVPPGDTIVKLAVQAPKGAVKLWSEFEQPLYEAVVVDSQCGVDNNCARFGFRSYTTRGAQFFINGKPVLLRGEANNAQFPLTGYPPMGKAQWLEIFKRFKDFGLNHFRCHTWTPPEAAFAAADEVGIYLQPEAPIGGAITNEAGKVWRQAEFDRILETYGNHPSFVQTTMGNEAKATQLDFLKELVKRGRDRDRRHLYASISNPEAAAILDEVPGDDFAVAHGSSKGRRRMHDIDGFNRAAPETVGDYRATMEGRPVPQISHEVGQWYVYPDLSEIAKYSGVLRPVTLEHFRDLAAREGVLPQVPEFVNASGRLSLLLYKEEVERSLRTPQHGGFQLLGLQDSFDQGAAYVGQINNFFEPKPYVTAAMFREFCSSQVPLVRLAKRVWQNDETFTAGIELANYGRGTLKHKTVTWQLRNGQRVAGKGTFGPLDLADTGLQPVGTVEFPLGGIRQATKLELQVGVEGTDIRNRWDLWVYPTTYDTNTPANVKVVRKLDPATTRELHDGARVVLLPEAFKSDYPTAMTPPFWSPIMFTEPQITGFLCDPKHPAFREFPTDSHSNWQWYELLHQGSATRLEGTPADYRPIVQGIDRPDRNHKLALLYETKVGKGSLLVCTLDLNRDLEKRPVARQLRRSLIDYAVGAEFHPATELNPEKNVPTFNAVLAEYENQRSAN